MVTNHQRGLNRDRQILDAVDRMGVLDTEQIHAMYFARLKYGRRIAQKRLQRLVELKKLSRKRPSFDRCHYYFTQPRKQIDHRLGVNWIRLWFMQKMKSWETLHSWEYEPQEYGVIPDAMYALKNTVKGTFTLYFIEFDTIENRNPFDKIGKYNDLYESGKYSWWGDVTDRFPITILTADTAARLETMRRKAEAENRNGLRFEFYLLDNIKKEVCHV